MKNFFIVSLCTFLLTTAITFAAEKNKGLFDFSKNATYTMSSNFGHGENIDFLLKDGNRTTGENKDSFAFHTVLEDNPFIIIDLKKVVTINKIEIQNRLLGGQERAKTLTIWVSKDKKEWKEIWKAPKVETNWTIDTNTPKVQFVKIGLTEKNYLHLNKVRIYGK